MSGSHSKQEQVESKRRRKKKKEKKEKYPIATDFTAVKNKAKLPN